MRWVKLAIIIYCLLGCILYYLQDKMLLRGVPVAPYAKWQFTEPFNDVNIVLDADNQYNLVQFTVPDSIRKGVVLYFHGNRDNISRYAPFATWFTRNGYEVWMPDYPGYGKSIGEASEKMFYEEALQVYKLARSKYEPGKIVLYGKSLGSGIAAQLASVRDCRRLILETPYYSMTSLVRPYAFIYPLGALMHFKLPTNTYLPKVTAPITIFQGTDDGVVPYRNAARLKPLLKQGDGFITVEGGSHNDLGKFPVVQKAIDSLLRQ